MVKTGLQRTLESEAPVSLFPFTLPKSLPQVSAQGGSRLLHEQKIEQPRFYADSKILGGTVLTALSLIDPDLNTQRQEGKIKNNVHSGSSLLFPWEV